MLGLVLTAVMVTVVFVRRVILRHVCSKLLFTSVNTHVFFGHDTGMVMLVLAGAAR